MSQSFRALSYRNISISNALLQSLLIGYLCEGLAERSVSEYGILVFMLVTMFSRIKHTY